jgi:N-acetylmuramoyl-L-alanine amidase
MYLEVISAVDLDIAARTVAGEARGESSAGKLAVALVILNRAKKAGWMGNTIEGVCLKAYQFSCWNDDDPNRLAIERMKKTDPVYMLALFAVAEAIVTDEDITEGATHYHTKDIEPFWIEGREPCTIIENHVFYNDIP